MTSPNTASDSPLALITGASSGIGMAVARQLAKRGYRTILIARRFDRLRELADELQTHAPSYPYAMDLSWGAAVSADIAKLLELHGPPKVIVNAGGHGMLQAFHEVDADAFDRMMQVHYFAPAAIMRTALLSMIESGGGHVINICSISSKVAPWGHSGYAAAKSALAVLTQSLAVEYESQGMHFCVVHPGIIQTEFFDGPQFASMAEQVRKHAVSPDYAADKIIALIDHPKREIVVPRLHKIVDWIRLFAPSIVHKHIARQCAPKDEMKCHKGDCRGTPGARG